MCCQTAPSNDHITQVRWHTPVVPASGRTRHAIRSSKSSSAYGMLRKTLSLWGKGDFTLCDFKMWQCGGVGLGAGSAPRSNPLREKPVHPTSPEDLPQRWSSLSPGCSLKSPQIGGHKRTQVYYFMAQESTILLKQVTQEHACALSGGFVAFLAASELRLYSRPESASSQSPWIPLITNIHRSCKSLTYFPVTPKSMCPKIRRMIRLGLGAPFSLHGSWAMGITVHQGLCTTQRG